jgi:hypothetical protein
VQQGVFGAAANALHRPPHPSIICTPLTVCLPFRLQLDNGIPIESWFDDRGDTELLKLVRFLETIQHTGDVRPLVREKFKLHKLVSDAT